jgi:plasmid stabilization system protein ParE
MEVLVTPRAAQKFEALVAFITHKWGEKAASAFIQNMDAAFSQLQSYPLLGVIEHLDIRGLQVSAQTRILYRIRNNKIIIISFFDVKQHPKKRLG